MNPILCPVRDIKNRTNEFYFSTMKQAFCQSLYFSQTCNLQAEFVYTLSAQSRQTNSACRLQVWLKYKLGQNACRYLITTVLFCFQDLRPRYISEPWNSFISCLSNWWHLLITTVTRSFEMIQHLHKHIWVFNINFEPKFRNLSFKTPPWCIPYFFI